jgi:hypothetical protein
MQLCVVKCSTEQEASAGHKKHARKCQKRECDTMKEGLDPLYATRL